MTKSFLTEWAPSRGSGRDGRTLERSVTFWAVSSFFPSMLKEPSLGWKLVHVASGFEPLGGVS